VYFAGKRVIILPDNDEIGRDHAEKVARSVAKFAVGVRVVNLPDLPAKGDISDYLSVHTKEQFIEEIKRAPAWKPHDQPHVMLAEATEFAVSAPEEVDWALEGIIERGSNGIIAGEPKHAKSIFAGDLCLAVATGSTCLGFRVPRRMKCALVSREDFPGMTARRITQLYRGSDADRHDLAGWLWVNTRSQTPNFLLEDESSVNRLIKEFKQEQIEFACFDVFRRLHMADENDNTQMAQILAVLSRIQQEVGCALALVHHVNREVSHSIFRRIRGASAIHGWLEWGIGITVVNEQESPQQWIRQVQFECKSACAQSPRYFRIDDTGGNLRLALTDAPKNIEARAQRSAASFMKNTT
jgi:RecA-family ATPase